MAAHLDALNIVIFAPPKMEVKMEYLYYLANASLTLRIVEYLHAHPQIPLDFISVINLIDGWIVRVKMKYPLPPQREGDFRAYLNELGISHQPPKRIAIALRDLEAGQSPTKVMERYQVVVVSHGNPEQEEIEAFREQFIERLGYCPQHMV